MYEGLGVMEMQWVQRVRGNGDATDVNIHEGGHNIRMINGVGRKKCVGDFTISGKINVGD